MRLIALHLLLVLGGAQTAAGSDDAIEVPRATARAPVTHYDLGGPAVDTLQPIHVYPFRDGTPHTYCRGTGEVARLLRECAETDASVLLVYGADATMCDPCDLCTIDDYVLAAKDTCGPMGVCGIQIYDGIRGTFQCCGEVGRYSAVCCCTEG